jgi:hypothetical protein
MYASPIGSISGIIHVAARRPFISAIVAVVVLTTALVIAPPIPAALATAPAAPIVSKLPDVLKIETSQPCEVEIPQPGSTPRQIGNCYFQYSAPPYPVLGARVDNVCKAKLDGTVLALKQAEGTIILEGNSLSGHGSIALSRARNVKAYLVANGIDPQRIVIKRGIKHQRAVDILLLP